MYEKLNEGFKDEGCLLKFIFWDNFNGNSKYNISTFHKYHTNVFFLMLTFPTPIGDLLQKAQVVPLNVLIKSEKDYSHPLIG